MNRNKKLLLNTIIPLVVQGLTLVRGLILPVLRLEAFGSEANGLVNSVTRFLSLISFLDLGVGAVVRYSLYKPLADGDIHGISRIVTSAQKFFRKIAMVLLLYIVVLCVAFPFGVSSSFSYWYIAALILIISASSFVQYYFGIVDGILLTADQRGYIQYTLQAITIVVNIIVSVVLIKNGFSLQTVMLASTIVYIVRPIAMRIYVNRHYRVNRRESYSEEPIKQKWNGLAQHVAAVIIDEADTVVLTLFSTLTVVSIYSVYHMIVFNVKTPILFMMSGVQAVLGEYWAKQEHQKLQDFFRKVEWIVHSTTILIFGCMSVLLVPFVSIYTANVADADYYQPVFSYLIVLANAWHCLRLPYNTMVLAAGKFKETQKNYIVAAVLNVVISVVTVHFLGLIGVAIGTLVAMVYQTIWMEIYLSKNVLRWPVKSFIKQILVDAVVCLLGIIATYRISLMCSNYQEWFLVAVVDLIIWIAISFVVNMVFYKGNVRYVFDTVRSKVFKR